MTTFTTYKTWTGVALPASEMNTYVRDNGNYLYERAPMWKIYKSADESRNTTTTPANDSTLLWAVEANDVWHFQLWLYYTGANTTMDLKVAWSVPASATMAWGSFRDTTSSMASLAPVITTATPETLWTESGTLSYGTSAGGNHIAVLSGLVFIAGTAGNVNFQWSQVTSNGSNLTVKKGSFLFITKISL